MTYNVDMENIGAGKPGQAKKSRLEARISSDLKSRLERAASLKGLTLSSFVVRSMEKIATEVIEAHEHKELSLSEQRAFYEALMNPPEPNPKMLAAARRYRESKA